MQTQMNDEPQHLKTMTSKHLGWFVQVGLEGGQKSLLLFHQKPAFALKIGTPY